MAIIKTEAVLHGFAPDRPDGNVKCRFGKYDFDVDGVATTGDTIQMVPIPKDAMIIDILVQGDVTGLGAVEIGDGDSAARYFSNLALTSMTDIQTLQTNGTTLRTLGHKYTDDDTIDITGINGTTLTTETVMLCVLYTISINDSEDAADAD